MKGPSNLILLFYDGYERQAAATLLGSLKAEARRHARFVWRTLRRKQVRTGYYTAFLNLCLALRRGKYDVRINDFATARRFPDHPIAVAGYPTVFAKVESLKNPRLIGPGPYSSPTENPRLMEDPRNRFFIQRCEWMKNLFAPFYGEERLRVWFRGFDVKDFEDVRSVPKQYDVLIYDKIYHQRDTLYAQTIASFIKELEAQGLTYRVFRYGYYIRQDYLAALRVSRALAFFAHSETQGHAYQEAMAMNVPVFAWDEGVWLDPLAKEVSDKPIPATSVPHFDDRCGVRFKAANMLAAFAEFWPKLETFRPREFVAETLSLKRSAELYVAAYREAGDSVASRAGSAHKIEATAKPAFSA
jgi:glycosyltransferase involved in cell wall biosynthesis